MTTAISGLTRVTFVVADPVAQLRTPQGLNVLWQDRAVDVITVPAHVVASELGAFFAGLRSNKSCLGAVLTVPHKQTAMALCDELGDGARVAGAVNVVRRRPDGSLLGETFDGLGFVAGLADVGFDCAGVPTVLIGAGGAASAIAAALLKAGVTRLDVVNRSEQRARELVDRLAELYPGRDIGVGKARSLEAGLVVNATSLGMSKNDPIPFPVELIPSAAVAADVVMQAELTPFLAAALSQGAIVHEGRHMLAGQLRLIADFLLAPDGKGS